MNDIQLKPCPFCGGEAELTYTNDNHHKPFVKCRFGAFLETICVACQYPRRHDSVDEAVEAWNRRVGT